LRRTFLAALVAALAVPAAVHGAHVPDGTYVGEVTTGQGGTVTLDVSPDGQMVEASFSGLGHPDPGNMCTGVGFGTDQVPIVDHGFDYLSDDGLRSANGTFGESSVNGGAQVLTTPCTTGSQAWRVLGPDAFLAPNDRGLDVFNATGEGQTRQLSAKRGDSGFFPINLKNAGVNPAAFLLDGCKPSKGFRVTYRDPFGVNVTDVVTDGTYETDELPADAIEFGVIEAQIKVLNSAQVGKTKTCKIEVDSGLLVDVVKAKLKARR
jgi:hypothetical protein